MERYRVKVHRKGLVVIPVEIRRKLGISEGSYVEFIVEGDTVKLVVPKSLKDAFGVDGEKALEVVKLISVSRRKEVEEEIRS
ncbi:MAG: AbrB family transcriptional regulator [Thermoprotei archaeon]|nr:MAG: AbrB family transcriptional regulator [Thermoprotei archaeon]